MTVSVSEVIRRRRELAHGLLRAILLLMVFAIVAGASHRAVDGTTFDNRALDWFVAHRSIWLTGPAIAITDMWSPAATIVSAFVIAAILWWRRRSILPALTIVVTLGIAGAASTILKVVVAVQRPPAAAQLLSETDASFPSGHVTGTIALTMIVATVLGHQRAPMVRTCLYGAAVAITAVVALTRLYLGVHWVTDVVGGILLGGAAATIGSTAFRMLVGEPRGKMAAHSVGSLPSGAAFGKG